MYVYMAEISSVYGKDFQQKSKLDSAKATAKLIANNIAHKEFVFRYNSDAMWNGNNMTKEAINHLLSAVHAISKTMFLQHVDKTSSKVNMFPYLINGPVEYFVLVDNSEDIVSIICLYITPTIMEPF